MSNAFPRAVRVRPGDFVVAVLGALLLAEGCADLGDSLPSAPAGNSPTISELVPARTFPGDTVQVRGSGFGTTPGRVVFTSSSLRAVVDATVVTWANDRIVVLSEGAGRLQRVDPRTPERLVRIDVADAGENALVEKGGLHG